jgi:hypothetical protein
MDKLVGRKYLRVLVVPALPLIYALPPNIFVEAGDQIDELGHVPGVPVVPPLLAV